MNALLVERFLITITNLYVFFLYTALKLLTVTTAMLKNFALSKEKISNKFYATLIKKRSTSVKSSFPFRVGHPELVLGSRDGQGDAEINST